MIPIVMQFSYGQILVENALHSLAGIKHYHRIQIPLLGSFNILIGTIPLTSIFG